MIKTGLWVVFGAWVPVIVIGLMDPTSHPVGLAIIAWAGTMVGCGVAASGIGLWVFRRAGTRRRRS